MIRVDKYGQAYTTEYELCDMLYKQPDLTLNRFKVVDASTYNNAIADTYAGFDPVRQYWNESIPIEDFDRNKQGMWHMPQEYKDLDIAEYILSLCKTDFELQRVGEELLLYHERDLFDLLRYLKYFVDTMRANNVLWGVGRGSSVSSYCLFLLQVHRINSIFYDLEIEEFLK